MLSRTWLPFNLNNSIKIRLTPRGEEEYKKQFLYPPLSHLTDGLGYVTMPLIDCLMIFREVFPELPFEDDLYFEELSYGK